MFCRLLLLQNETSLQYSATSPPITTSTSLERAQRGQGKTDGRFRHCLERNWSAIAVVNHTTTMTSRAFEHLVGDTPNKNITFMHASPGFVQTDIFAKLKAPKSSGIVWIVALASIRGIVSIVMQFFGISIKESGERHAYHLTSDKFRQPGFIRVDATSDGGYLSRRRARKMQRVLARESLGSHIARL